MARWTLPHEQSRNMLFYFTWRERCKALQENRTMRLCRDTRPDLQGRSEFRGVPKTQEMSNIAATELRSVRRPGESQTSADLSDPATRQVAKKKRRSADAVALGFTHDQAKYKRESLGGGSGRHSLLSGLKARSDPQQVYPSTKKRAKTAAGASWEGYIEWKQSLSLEVCSRTGAILSITWDRDDAGPRDPLSAGSAKRCTRARTWRTSS
jgi:hypothetical protein